MRIRTYRFRLYPNRQQRQALDRDVNAARNILTLAVNPARIEPSGRNVGAVKAVRVLRSPAACYGE